MIEAKNLVAKYGRKTALHGVDLTAHAGELTAIVGPNGSGKSTLLKAISGDIALSGQVTLNGRDITQQSAWQLAAQRGVLPQASSLAFPFRVREVVEIGLSAGQNGADAGLVQRALDRVGLGEVSERLYQELSGGQQQRVQLARVLAQIWEPVVNGAPRWLFLDEPVSSLDIAHQLSVMTIARDFARAGGGVVAVMHDLNLTAMFADRVKVMRGGESLAEGCMSEVLCDAILTRAYDCPIRMERLDASGIPFFLPQTSGHTMTITP